MNGVNLWASHKDYAGVIKVTPIPRNLNIRTGVLADAFDKAVKVPPEPPWIDAEKKIQQWSVPILATSLQIQFLAR